MSATGPVSRNLELMRGSSDIQHAETSVFREGEVAEKFALFYPLVKPIYDYLWQESDEVLSSMNITIPVWPNQELLGSLAEHTFKLSFQGIEVDGLSKIMRQFSAPEYAHTMQSLRAGMLWECADIHAQKGTWSTYWRDTTDFDTFRKNIHALRHEDLKPFERIFANVPMATLLDTGCVFLDAIEIYQLAFDELNASMQDGHSQDLVLFAQRWSAARSKAMQIAQDEFELAHDIIGSHELLLHGALPEDVDPIDVVGNLIHLTQQLADTAADKQAWEVSARKHQSDVIQLSEAVQHTLLCMRFVKKQQANMQELSTIWFGGMSRMLPHLSRWISLPKSPEARSQFITSYNGFLHQLFVLKSRYDGTFQAPEQPLLEDL